MIYIRGQKEDYDDWVSEWGCDGWGYEDVLPHFRKAEANESLGDRYHGETGAVPVSENRYRHPLTQACIRACEQMGLPYTNDFNGASQEGAGFYQATIKIHCAEALISLINGNIIFGGGIDGHMLMVVEIFPYRQLNTGFNSDLTQVF